MDPNNVYDSFKKKGANPSFENRKRVYYMNYGHDEEYRGTPAQNNRMNDDIKRGRLYLGLLGEKMLV